MSHLPAGMSALAVCLCLCLAGCGGGRSSAATNDTTPTRSAATSSPAPITRAATTVARRSRPRHSARRRDPCPSRSSGPLTQTDRVPSTRTPCFRAVVRALWRGVQDNSGRAAQYAFFPLRAYQQVKAVADASGDYSGRLVTDYRLDLRAAHGLLGPHPARARLIRALVPRAYVHWVRPGACANRLGYYEVPNSRLIYRIGRKIRSFGIASLISWRGTWYVVHLGAVVRSGATGTVDDPSAGSGTPAPSQTC